MLLRMALFFLNYPVRISQKSCRATARQDGFTTLRESCRELVLAGVTSAVEAARVINTAAET